MSNGDLATLRAILAERGDSLRRLPNVVGTGIGKRQRGSVEGDELCIRIYVERKVRERDLRDDEVVPKELRLAGVGAAPTDVEETGSPRALQLDTAKCWPVQGGCYLEPKGTGTLGGTLGGIAFDRQTHDPAWISARHCIWKAGNDPVDPAKVWQSSSRMGMAYDVAPMVFYTASFDVLGAFHIVNPVDAAKGDFRWLLDEPGGVSFSVLDIGPAIFEVAAPWENPIEPSLGLPVLKHGIATGTTAGHVQDIDVTAYNTPIDDHWASVGGIGRGFTVVSDTDKPFVDDGDSGSVVFAKEAGESTTRPAIGLVWMRQGGTCFASAMTEVFEQLALDTICTGMFKKALAVIGAREVEFEVKGSSRADESYRRLRELRSLTKGSDPGRALIDVVAAAVPMVAEAVYRDPVAFGLYADLLSRWELSAATPDLLESTIDSPTVDLAHRFLERLEHVQPDSARATTEIGRAIGASRNLRLADLLHVEIDR